MSTTEVITLVVAIIGAVTGIVGMVLGIISTWMQVSQSRVRLEVLPKTAYRGEHGMISVDRPSITFGKLPTTHLCVEVINQSAFAVTISDVGFGRPKRQGRRHTFTMVQEFYGDRLPKRLEPHQSTTIFVRPDLDYAPNILATRVASARTD